MTFSDLATIGSLVGSLAVCGSLIYLALQVRQSDRNQRTLLQQGTSARAMETTRDWTEPHLAELYAKALNGDTDFTPAQVLQLLAQIHVNLLSFQDHFLLEKTSLIDSTQFESQKRSLKLWLSPPVMRALWSIVRDHFAPEFADYVDAQMKGVPPSAPVNPTAALRAAVTEVHAPAVLR